MRKLGTRKLRTREWGTKELGRGDKGARNGVILQGNKHLRLI